MNKTKPLDLTKPMQTLDGRPVRLLASDLKNDEHNHVFAVTTPQGREYLSARKPDGKETPGMEVIVNPPETVTRYVNIYEDRVGDLWNSRDHAVRYGKTGRDSLLKIEFSLDGGIVSWEKIE